MATALQHEEAAFGARRKASGTGGFPAQAHAPCAGLGLIVSGSKTPGWSRGVLGRRADGRVHGGRAFVVRLSRELRLETFLVGEREFVAQSGGELTLKIEKAFWA